MSKKTLSKIILGIIICILSFSFYSCDLLPKERKLKVILKNDVESKTDLKYDFSYKIEFDGEEQAKGRVHSKKSNSHEITWQSGFIFNSIKSHKFKLIITDVFTYKISTDTLFGIPIRNYIDIPEFKFDSGDSTYEVTISDEQVKGGTVTYTVYWGEDGLLFK